MMNSITYFIQRLTLLTMWITYNVVFTYLQYNTITYDTNNTNAYMITHVAYVDSVVLSIKILL